MNSSTQKINYSRKLSHMISRILREVWMKEESVCLSTEEMVAGFQRYNKRKDSLFGLEPVRISKWAFVFCTKTQL